MKKYVIASVLGLGLGALCAGQALAEQRTSGKDRSHGRDTSPPVITADVKGTQGNNGWYQAMSA